MVVIDAFKKRKAIIEKEGQGRELELRQSEIEIYRQMMDMEFLVKTTYRTTTKKKAAGDGRQ